MKIINVTVDQKGSLIDLALKIVIINLNRALSSKLRCIWFVVLEHSDWNATERSKPFLANSRHLCNSAKLLQKSDYTAGFHPIPPVPFFLPSETYLHWVHEILAKYEDWWLTKYSATVSRPVVLISVWCKDCVVTFSVVSYKQGLHHNPRVPQPDYF